MLSAHPVGTFALFGPWILWISYPIQGREKGMEKGMEKFRRLMFAMTFACRRFRGGRLRLALRQHPELSKLVESWPHLPSSVRIEIIANGGEQRQWQMNNAQ